MEYIWSAMALIALSILYWQYVPKNWLEKKEKEES